MWLGPTEVRGRVELRMQGYFRFLTSDVDIIQDGIRLFRLMNRCLFAHFIKDNSLEIHGIIDSFLIHD